MRPPAQPVCDINIRWHKIVFIIRKMLEDSECFIIHIKNNKKKEEKKTEKTTKAKNKSSEIVYFHHFRLSSVLHIYIYVDNSVRFVCEFTFHSV